MKFWELYGQCIKPGVHENSTNRTKTAALLRLDSSKSENSRSMLRSKFMIDTVYEDAVQQLNEFHGKKLKSTTKHILKQLMCYLQINSLVLQATNTDIFGFKITMPIQPLRGVMWAQEPL